MSTVFRCSVSSGIKITRSFVTTTPNLGVELLSVQFNTSCTWFTFKAYLERKGLRPLNNSKPLNVKYLHMCTSVPLREA